MVDVSFSVGVVGMVVNNFVVMGVGLIWIFGIVGDDGNGFVL